MPAKVRKPASERPPMTVQRVLLDSLHVDPANLREHDSVNIAAIRASLEAHGQVEPLVVQSSTRRLIGGNGRLAAMVELGWIDCDAVFLDIDDAAARALSIRLNRTAELGRWSADLDAAIRELAAGGVDLESLGFGSFKLDGDPAVPEPVGGEVKLTNLSTLAPPAMAWVLIGIPTVRFGELAIHVDNLAKIPGILCETSVGGAG